MDYIDDTILEDNDTDKPMGFKYNTLYNYHCHNEKDLTGS